MRFLGKVLLAAFLAGTVVFAYVYISPYKYKPRQRIILEGRSIGGMAFSADGLTVATGGVDLTLWDMTTGKERFRLSGECRTFALDRKSLAAVTKDGKVKLWDVATGKERVTVKGHDTEPDFLTRYSLAFSADGQTLASSCQEEIKIWDVATGQERMSFTADSEVLFVGFAGDGKTLISCGEQDEHGVNQRGTTLWDMSTGRKRAQLECTCAALSPANTMLAWGKRQRLELWDLAKKPRLLTSFAEPSETSDLAFSPDGRFLAVGLSGSRAQSGNRAQLWGIDGRRIATFAGHCEDFGTWVAFLSDGKTLVSGAGCVERPKNPKLAILIPTKGEINLWDVGSILNAKE